MQSYQDYYTRSHQNFEVYRWGLEQTDSSFTSTLKKIGVPPPQEILATTTL